MTVIFKYRREQSGILRPVADIVLKTAVGATGVALYIDSGADISMVPRQTGEALGFQEGKGKIQEMKGIAGEGVPFIEIIVNAVLGGEVEVAIPIAWALIEGVPPLLGRKGIFDKFKIVFDEAEETVEFHKK